MNAIMGIYYRILMGWKVKDGQWFSGNSSLLYALLSNFTGDTLFGYFAGDDLLERYWINDLTRPTRLNRSSNDKE